MPLRRGKKWVQYNIRELMRSWEKDGKIGRASPKTKKEALRMAIAIAMRKAREKPRSRQG